MSGPSFRRSPDALVALGAALMVMSAFFPWIEARTRSSEFRVTPGLESVLAPGTILVLFLLVVGLVVFVVNGFVGLLGAMAALWFNLSITFWLFGASAASWLPTGLLPDNPAASVELGAALGLTGSLVMLAGVALHLAERTWNFHAPSINSWTFIFGAALALIAIVSRSVPWITLEAVNFEWELAADAIPIVGDLISGTLLVVAVIAMLVGTVGGRTIGLLGVIAGAALFGLSLLGALSGSLLERAGAELAERAGLDIDVVTASMLAPAAFALVAVGTIALSAWGLPGRSPAASTQIPTDGQAPTPDAGPSNNDAAF